MGQPDFSAREVPWVLEVRVYQQLDLGPRGLWRDRDLNSIVSVRRAYSLEDVQPLKDIGCHLENLTNYRLSFPGSIDPPWRVTLTDKIEGASLRDEDAWSSGSGVGAEIRKALFQRAVDEDACRH
jgi:hypothetical protein